MRQAGHPDQEVTLELRAARSGQMTCVRASSAALLFENVLHLFPKPAILLGPVSASGPAETDRFTQIHLAPLSRREALVEPIARSEEHTSELPSLMRLSYAVFCL